MKIEMTDGRILIGTFVCTDKDANIILSACSELFNTKSKFYKQIRNILLHILSFTANFIFYV